MDALLWWSCARLICDSKIYTFRDCFVAEIDEYFSSVFKQMFDKLLFQMLISKIGISILFVKLVPHNVPISIPHYLLYNT